MKDNVINLLLSALHSAEYDLSQITHNESSLQAARQTAMIAQDELRSRVEHATGWNWEALEGDEDITLVADAQWREESGWKP